MNKICVIGLGYVGLPLAHAFSSKYEVVGFDISKWRIDELSSGYDRTLELSSEQVNEAIKNGMKFTLDTNDIKDCNIYIVTVPTPIKDNNDPDLTPLIKSSETVAKVLKQNDIVIYESTVYPGVTEEVCVPVLEKFSNLKFNEDFFCGYSPERINPGDKEHTVTKILKITSGSTPETAKKVDELYKSIIKAGTHLASSIKVAEAAKVIEPALTNPETANDPETWKLAGDFQKAMYDDENMKLYLPGGQADTTRLYNSLAKMYEYYLKCDEMEQAKVKSGEMKKPKYRKKNANALKTLRLNLINGGGDAYNKGDYADALKYFGLFVYF